MSLLPSFLAGRFAGHLPARQPAAKPKRLAPRVVTGPIRHKTLQRLIARGIDPSRLRVTSMVAVARRGPKPLPMPMSGELTSPLSNEGRRARYYAQNGTDRLTPRQRRRYDHKWSYGLARRREAWAAQG